MNKYENDYTIRCVIEDKITAGHFYEARQLLQRALEADRIKPTTASQLRRRLVKLEQKARPKGYLPQIEVKIIGVVQGFQREGESLHDAAGRITMDAELRANAEGDIRVHISMQSSGGLPAVEVIN